MAYFAALLGEYVFALVCAFVEQLFSSNAETPSGTTIVADHRMNWSSKDLQNHKGLLVANSAL